MYIAGIDSNTYKIIESDDRLLDISIINVEEIIKNN